MRRYALLLWFILNHLVPISAQNDSLWNVWHDTTQPDSARLKAMQILSWKAVFERPDSGIALATEQLAFAERTKAPMAQYDALTTLAVGSSMKGDHAAALAHFGHCLELARNMDDRKREANTHSNLSNVYRSMGDLPAALEQLRKSEGIDTGLKNLEGLAGTYNNLGNLYTELGELEQALENYRRSATLAEELDSDRGRAQAIQNLGATWLQLGRLDTALTAFHQALDLYRRMGRKLEMGMACNNLGRAYGLLDRMPDAHAYLDSALELLSAVRSDRHLSRTYINRGQVYLRAKQAPAAVKACNEGRRIAQERGLLQQEKECQECLAEAYAATGQHRKAFSALQAYNVLNDSLQALNNGREVMRMDVTRSFQERMFADSLSNVRATFERELAYQHRLGEERDRRNVSVFAGIGVLALAIGLWTRLRHTRRSRAAIQHERDRSDGLLLNILPAEVAQELKDTGKAKARLYEQVTVLFTDFKGFTALSEQLTPDALVAEIDSCFRAFDAILEKHGIEKIKTIGDAYMAAGGLPDPATGRPIDVVRAALEMQDHMATYADQRKNEGRPFFEMRLGIHTGPVIAGIVGAKKFAYDIWGDTVNTASRMESSGEVGRVNISGNTHALVKDVPSSTGSGPEFAFVHRGRVHAKGKGDLDMYFLERHSKELAS